MPTDANITAWVHRAWADGSSWNKVIQQIHQIDIKTVTTLIPITAYADDVAALDRALERGDGPVVLVGHAYAGAAIGGSRSDQAKALVHAAALAPDEGDVVAH